MNRKIKISYAKHPFDEYPVEISSSAKTLGGLVAACDKEIRAALVIVGDNTFRFPECKDEIADFDECRIIQIPKGNKKIWKGIWKGIIAIAAAATAPIWAPFASLVQIGLYAYGAFKVLQGSIALAYYKPIGKQGEFKNAYSLTGGSNAQAQGNPMPFILGKFRIYPCIVGNYYSTLTNNTGEGKQLGTAVMCLGQANLKITNIRIGNNILSYNPSGSYGSVQIDGAYTASCELTNGETSLMYNSKIYEQNIGAECEQQTIQYGKIYKARIDFLIAQNAELQKEIEKLDFLIAAAELNHRPYQAEKYKKQKSALQAQIAANNAEIADLQQKQEKEGIVGNYKNTQTTAANANSFTVVFGFQGLGRYNDENKKRAMSRQVCIIYRAAESGSAWTKALYEKYERAQPDKALVFYKTVNLSAEEKASNPSGKWEVAVFATDSASTEAGQSNKLYWQSLRTNVDDAVIRPRELPHLSLLTLRIQADANTQGNLQQISAECQSICPIWNGQDWSESAPTSNPAALFRFVCSQYFENGFDENSLDNDAIAALYDWCDVNGYECNAAIDSEEPLIDILNKILQCAQAKVILRGGKLSIWHDIAQANPVALLTPKNSSNFEATKVLNNRVNAVRIKWNDPAADYKETTSEVYLQGESASADDDIQDVELFGLTNHDQVFKLGRYLLATVRLRPETYKLKVGIEHYNLPFGARVLLASDVLAVSDACGRTIGNGSDELGSYCVIDEILAPQTSIESPNGNPYYMRVQNVQSGAISLRPIYRNALATNRIRFADNGALPPIGSIYAIGELETLDCIIIGKEIADDDTCQLTLAAYDENIYNAISAPIPPYNPKISQGQSTAGGLNILTDPAASGQFDFVNQKNFGGIFFDFGVYSVLGSGFKNQGTLGDFAQQPTIGTMQTRFNSDRGFDINWLQLTSAQSLGFYSDTLLYNAHTLSFALANVSGEGDICRYEDADNNNRFYIRKLANGKMRVEFDDVYHDFDYDWAGEHLLTFSRNPETGFMTFWVDKQQIFDRNYLDVREIFKSEDDENILRGENARDILTSESRFVAASGGIARDKKIEFMLSGISGEIATIRIWNLPFYQNATNQLYDNDSISFGISTLADWRGEFETEPEITKLGDTFKYLGATNAKFIQNETYWLTEGGWVLYKII